MRNNLVTAGAEELRYEIREIVSVANEFQKLGVKISWENIGDPVSKGEKIPLWMKEIVQKAAMDDMAYAYSPTKGIEATREFLANVVDKRNGGKGVKITKDDIIFFNGTADAISMVYRLLRPRVRVIGPSPTYSTHSSAEASHAGSPHLTYNLDPDKNWQPDLADLRNNIRYNQNISGILIINPNNPTGAVYSEEVMKSIVKIAKEYDLFIIADEIYTNIAYNGKKAVPLSDVINGVPGISMKGISKELPWPGARCGWIEVYNADKDANFKRYVESIVHDKMLEVCSTTMPQMVIPQIFSDKRYAAYQRERNKIFERRSNIAYNLLKDVKGIKVIRTDGAFYMTIVFEDKVLNNKQKLEIKNNKAKAYAEKLVKDVNLDKRFVYYLLASTGICVVPLTSFESSLNGFRITLLETDEKKFKWIFEAIKEKIGEYLSIK